MPDPWRQRVAARAGLAIGILCLLLAFLLAWQYVERRTMKIVIAVLPFHADPATTTLADQITDSLAARLARVHNVSILPSVRTADYRTTRDSAHAIARTLGVRYLLVGRVERAPLPNLPDRIFIDARLIDTQDSPPTMGSIIVTTTADLCPATDAIVHDIAAHFARAPLGHRYGPGGLSGCAAPSLLEESDDPGA
jgi:TolB-like protein